VPLSANRQQACLQCEDIVDSCQVNGRSQKCATLSGCRHTHTYQLSDPISDTYRSGHLLQKRLRVNWKRRTKCDDSAAQFCIPRGSQGMGCMVSNRTDIMLTMNSLVDSRLHTIFTCSITITIANHSGDLRCGQSAPTGSSRLHGRTRSTSEPNNTLAESVSTSAKLHCTSAEQIHGGLTK